ncbi:hypothetical protein BTS2_1118 [Bacillus sp. TS-2]|nr:hypothetical protein BTS2_1118 [Bacillus sp. TS-2]
MNKNKIWTIIACFAIAIIMFLYVNHMLFFANVKANEDDKGFQTLNIEKDEPFLTLENCLNKSLKEQDPNKMRFFEATIYHKPLDIKLKNWINDYYPHHRCYISQYGVMNYSKEEMQELLNLIERNQEKKKVRFQ